MGPAPPLGRSLKYIVFEKSYSHKLYFSIKYIIYEVQHTRCSIQGIIGLKGLYLSYSRGLKPLVLAYV